MCAVAAFTLAVQAMSAITSLESEKAALVEFATYCARSEQLWGRSLCGPMVLVAPKDRTAIANSQPAEPTFKRSGPMWIGKFPPNVGLANTAVQWGGKRWGQVLLPLPESPAERRVLLAHEAFHRIQPELGFRINEADNSHLDAKMARIYARLEMAALEAALLAARARGEWRNPARQALAYQHARMLLFAGAAKAEAALIANEGLAEYTGIRVGAPKVRTRLAIGRLTSGAKRESLIRSFGYVVGPAYGLLLDQTGGSWRRHALAGEPLPDLLRAALGKHDLPDADLTAYGGASIVAEETARDASIREQRRALTEALVEGPTVTFPFQQMKIDFDPNSLFALGDQGTIYRRATTIRDSWGELRVTGNVLVGPNWDFARVAGPASQSGSTISGPGWTAVLAPGYSLATGSRPEDRIVQRPTP